MKDFFSYVISGVYALDRILDSSKLKSTEDLFAEALDTALTTLYGVIGGALNWDLVEFQKDNCIATIQCQKR